MKNWADDSETGAPVINNVPGSVIAAIRAVCCTGFKVRSVTGIVVADEVATATTSTAHEYSSTYGKLVRISGSAVSALNGDKQPTSTGTNTFTYPAPGVADGAYTTGTIEARRAPLGWEELFTNEAGTISIFRRPSPEATTSLMRVVDTRESPASVTHARVTMLETATDLDTYTGECPLSAGDAAWLVGVNNATPKRWLICGDEKRAWFLLQPSGSGDFPVPYFFGDPVPLYPGDSGVCFHCGSGSTSLSVVGGFANLTPRNFAPTSGVSRLTFQRSIALDAVGVNADICGNSSGDYWGSNGLSGIGSAVPVVGDYYLKTSSEVRARLPGLFLPMANRLFTNLHIYDLPSIGRKLLAIDVMRNNTGVGQMMLDLTGPWD